MASERQQKQLGVALIVALFLAGVALPMVAVATMVEPPSASTPTPTPPPPMMKCDTSSATTGQTHNSTTLCESRGRKLRYITTCTTDPQTFASKCSARLEEI